MRVAGSLNNFKAKMGYTHKILLCICITILKYILNDMAEWAHNINVYSIEGVCLINGKVDNGLIRAFKNSSII